MKLDSTYFDRIRIKPEKPGTHDGLPGCEWPGLLTAMTVPRRAYPLSVQASVPVAEARDSGAPNLRGPERCLELAAAPGLQSGPA